MPINIPPMRFAASVPSGSVGSTTDRTFVVRVRNGKTEWVDVKTGLASGPLIEVFGNLQLVYRNPVQWLDAREMHDGARQPAAQRMVEKHWMTGS